MYNEINGRGNSLLLPRNTLYPQKLALTSGGRSVGIVRLRTKATEFFFIVKIKKNIICFVFHFLSCIRHDVSTYSKIINELINGRQSLWSSLSHLA
jgi:hypothetical protein